MVPNMQESTSRAALLRVGMQLVNRSIAEKDRGARLFREWVSTAARAALRTRAPVNVRQRRAHVFTFQPHHA